MNQSIAGEERPLFKRYFKSLWLGDPTWRRILWSTLVQVMACFLVPPSHYLSQWGLIIKGGFFFVHLTTILEKSLSTSIHKMISENCACKIKCTSPEAQWKLGGLHKLSTGNVIVVILITFMKLQWLKSNSMYCSYWRLHYDWHINQIKQSHLSVGTCSDGVFMYPVTYVRFQNNNSLFSQTFQFYVRYLYEKHFE